MDESIAKDLALHRISIVPNNLSPLIVSPLGFTPKHDGGLRKIHDLSHPKGQSVNDFIVTDHLEYVRFEAILDMIVKSGLGCIIFKRDMTDAFRNIPVA